MPKMKTHKATKKRVKATANGKIKISSPGKRHLMSCKSGDRKRKLGQRKVVADNVAKKILVLLGNSK